MTKLAFFSSFILSLIRAQNSGRWGSYGTSHSYSTSSEREAKKIEEDVRNFQKLGICGTSRVLPNELLFKGIRRREANEDRINKFVTTYLNRFKISQLKII